MQQMSKLIISYIELCKNFLIDIAILSKYKMHLVCDLNNHSAWLDRSTVISAVNRLVR